MWQWCREVEGGSLEVLGNGLKLIPLKLTSLLVVSLLPMLRRQAVYRTFRAFRCWGDKLAYPSSPDTESPHRCSCDNEMEEEEEEVEEEEEEEEEANEGVDAISWNVSPFVASLMSCMSLIFNGVGLLLPVPGSFSKKGGGCPFNVSPSLPVVCSSRKLATSHSLSLSSMSRRLRCETSPS